MAYGLNNLWRWFKRKDEQVFLEMAYPRAVFKDKLRAPIRGALGEFYKAECARANGLTKWVDHWTREVNQLLLIMSMDVYPHTITFSDRRKALAEILSELQRLDSGFRTHAANEVARDYKTKLKYPIPPDATKRFYEMVERYIQDAESSLL